MAMVCNQRNRRMELRRALPYVTILLLFFVVDGIVSDLTFDQPDSFSLNNEPKPISNQLFRPENTFQKYERLLYGDLCDITGRNILDRVVDQEDQPTEQLLSVDLDEVDVDSTKGFQQYLPKPSTRHRTPFELDTATAKKLLRSTGTTIAGICGRDFVVLGADTRATNGPMVADKRCWKIHQLADNVYACGAGTSADLEHLTRKILFQNKLQATTRHGTIGNSPSKGQLPNVQNVAKVCEDIREALYREGGRCSANLVVGGVYRGQAILRAIHPHGSQDALAFTALGSGGLAAMGVLEQGYQELLSIEEAKDLVTRAIRAGITNDLGSGSQVDLCIISEAGGTEMIRCHVPEDQLEPIEEESSARPVESERSLPGVNGFGNHAFYIRKIRTVAVSEDIRQAEETSKWQDILRKPTTSSLPRHK